jgi:hypothetical protein
MADINKSFLRPVLSLNLPKSQEKKAIPTPIHVIVKVTSPTENPFVSIKNTGKKAKYAYPAIPAKKTAAVRENLFTKDFCSSVFNCSRNVLMTLIKLIEINWINKLNKVKKAFQTIRSIKSNEKKELL